MWLNYHAFYLIYHFQEELIGLRLDEWSSLNWLTNCGNKYPSVCKFKNKKLEKQRVQLIKILVVLVWAEILIVNFLYSIVLWFGFLTKTGNLCIVALLLGWINGNACNHPGWVVRCPAAVQNECHLVEGTKKVTWISRYICLGIWVQNILFMCC